MKLFATSLAIFNLAQIVISWDCDSVLSRQSIYKMSNEDRNRYFNAVKAINSGPKPTEWDKFARRHVEFFGTIHGTPMFFPWHRLYLADLERLLRNIDPKVRIPFWDWTQYYDNRNNDPIWQWFGREGNRFRQNCVTTGVFNNFPVYYGPSMSERPSNRCFTRSPNPGRTFGCHPSDFTINVIDQKDTDSFWKYIENNCHNSVHSAIGGGFSDLISTNDPLFFSHHAFVDASWFLRQMRHSDLSYSYAGNLNDNIPYYNIPVSEVVDPTNLCYSYREDNYPWSNGQQAQVMNFPMPNPAPSPRLIPAKDITAEPFRPLLRMNLRSESNTQAIDNHAKQYVFKNITAPINQDTYNININGCKPIPLPDILSIDFIKMMGYNEVEVRELERKQALFIDNLNKKCSGGYPTFNSRFN